MYEFNYIITICFLDFEDISDGDSHSEGEGESDRGGCGMEGTMDISGISGTSKSSLVKKIHNEFNITRDGEPRRSLKRYKFLIALTKG